MNGLSLRQACCLSKKESLVSGVHSTWHIIILAFGKQLWKPKFNVRIIFTCWKTICFPALMTLKMRAHCLDGCKARCECWYVFTSSSPPPPSSWGNVSESTWGSAAFLTPQVPSEKPRVFLMGCKHCCELTWGCARSMSTGQPGSQQTQLAPCARKARVTQHFVLLFLPSSLSALFLLLTIWFWGWVKTLKYVRHLNTGKSSQNSEIV